MEGDLFSMKTPGFDNRTTDPLTVAQHNLTKTGNVSVPSNDAYFLYGHATAAIGFAATLASLLSLFHLKRPLQPFHLLLINLALTDLALVTFTLTGTGTYLYYDGPNSQVICTAYILTEVSYVSLLGPLIATVGIVVNQFLAIFKPLKYPAMVTKARVVTFIVCSWIFVFLVGLVLHLSTDLRLRSTSAAENCQCVYLCGNYLSVRPYVFFVFFVCFSAVAVVFYFMTYRVVNKQLRAPVRESVCLKPSVAGRHAQKRPDQKTLEQQRKLNVTIALLLGSVLIFWLPGIANAVIGLILAAQGKLPTPTDVLIHRVTNLIFLANPIVDPLVYGLRLPDVQHGYRRCVERVFGVCCNVRMVSGSSERKYTETVDMEVQSFNSEHVLSRSSSYRKNERLT